MGVGSCRDYKKEILPSENEVLTNDMGGGHTRNAPAPDPEMILDQSAEKSLPPSERHFEIPGWPAKGGSYELITTFIPGLMPSPTLTGGFP